MHATPSASAHSDALAASSPLHFMHATPSASARSDALEASLLSARTPSPARSAVTGTLSQLHAPTSQRLSRSRSRRCYRLPPSSRRSSPRSSRTSASRCSCTSYSMTNPRDPGATARTRSLSRSWRHRLDLLTPSPGVQEHDALLSTASATYLLNRGGVSR
ncbi:hypothetical protein T492DRAFT_503534 [Pavlovales sp. CCMP2436]|nr:hypothetical protein T492DRAFT_503534 [Pavlovales sp. CCMP2436]